MSLLHVCVTFGIGLGIGFIGYALRFDRYRGDVFFFPLMGILGAFALNLLFRLLVSSKLVYYLFYRPKAIVVEEIIGAMLFVYLLTLLRSGAKGK